MKILYKNIQNLTDEKFDSLMKKINEKKKLKINKIKNINDKKRSLLGEYLLIQLLSFQNINYNTITFYINEYGKPYIKNHDLFYNISHSHDYSACAISNKKIGIDIEKIRIVNENVINQFATPNEIKYINQNDGKEQKIKFFEIYTLKEAYFKCLGTNLNNIKNVEFTIKHNKFICSDSRVEIKVIDELKDYIISICEMKRDEK